MKKAESVARQIPGIYPIYRFLKFIYTAHRTHADQLLDAYPAGHFHSPLPDLKKVLSRREQFLDPDTREIEGIELRQKEQLELLDKMSSYYGDLNFTEERVDSKRYYYRNEFFSYADAIVLFGMLRHFKPRRIVEIGSGFSSAAMLDVNDEFFGGSIDFTFIEPQPQRLYALSRAGDDLRSRTLECSVQEVDLSVFDFLEENDFLFIDSSHVVKTGSDVAHILFEILPRLKTGVIVHFHDVFWPFEYPKEWIASGRAWNEAYFLRAFLQYNETFQILYFNSFMALFYPEILKDKMPLCLENSGGSLWLKKAR